MSLKSASSNQPQQQPINTNRLFKRRKRNDDSSRAFKHEPLQVPKLSNEEWHKTRELIRKSRIELAEQPRDDDYITNLIKRNRIYGENSAQLQQKFSKWISSVYYSLNEVALARAVMQIASTSPTLTIVFDVNQHHVACIDPYSNELTDGVTYGCFDQIIIAAKDLFVVACEHEVEFDAAKQRLAMGLLIHEFCHYAIHLVYDNGYQPFLADDRARREQFELVRAECRLKAHKSRVIGKAFDYDESETSQELIVRYVQAIIELSCDQVEVERFKSDFPLLRDYYEGHLMADLIMEYPRMRIMNQINEESGFSAANPPPMMVKRRRISDEFFLLTASHRNDVIILRANSTCTAMNEIYYTGQASSLKSIKLIFTSLKYVTKSTNNFELVCETLARLIKPVLVINCESSCGREIDETIIKFRARIKRLEKIVFICDRAMMIDGDYEVVYSGADLTDEFLERIVSAKVNFQDAISPLGDLISSDQLKCCANIPLDSIAKMNQEIPINLS